MSIFFCLTRMVGKQKIPIRKGKKEPILGVLRNRRKKREFKL